MEVAHHAACSTCSREVAVRADSRQVKPDNMRFAGTAVWLRYADQTQVFPGSCSAAISQWDFHRTRRDPNGISDKRHNCASVSFKLRRLSALSIHTA